MHDIDCAFEETSERIQRVTDLLDSLVDAVQGVDDRLYDFQAEHQARFPGLSISNIRTGDQGTFYLSCTASRTVAVAFDMTAYNGAVDVHVDLMLADIDRLESKLLGILKYQKRKYNL